MEVDAARKRIALSIKQTQDAPQRNQNLPAGGHGSKVKIQNRREPQVAEMSMNDALSALKKKFGK